jgi:hypothetical protein
VPAGSWVSERTSVLNARDSTSSRGAWSAAQSSKRRLPRPHDEREEQEPDLVEEAIAQQRPDEGGTARDRDVLPGRRMAQRYFDATRESSDAEFRADAPEHTVFRLERV